MAYYDHILMFNSEQEAVDTLTSLNFYDKEFGWVGNVIPNLQIFIPLGSFNEEGFEDRVSVPGYYVNVALEEPSKELMELPNEACRIVADREADSEGSNFFVYLNPNVDVQLLTKCRVSPYFSGSEYPFGAI